MNGRAVDEAPALLSAALLDCQGAKAVLQCSASTRTLCSD